MKRFLLISVTILAFWIGSAAPALAVVVPYAGGPVYVPHATFAPAFVPQASFGQVIPYTPYPTHFPGVPTPTQFPCVAAESSFCGYADDFYPVPPGPIPQHPTHVPAAQPPTYVPHATFTPVIPTPTLPSPFPCPTFLGSLCGYTADGVYVVLGDSMALGLYGAPGYADIVEDHWEQSANIELDSRSLARSGWHSSHLAAALQQDPLFQRTVAEADAVTWNIGGNDLRAARDLYYRGQCGGSDNQDCLRRAVTAFRSNWNVIVSELTAARSHHGTTLRSMDLYNPFVKEDMAQGTYTMFDSYFDQVNQHIASSLQANNIPYARLSSAFNGPDGLTDPADKGLIAFDGYHPNPAGHRVIANLLIQFGGPVIRPDTTPLSTVIP